MTDINNRFSFGTENYTPKTDKDINEPDTEFFKSFAEPVEEFDKPDEPDEIIPEENTKNYFDDKAQTATARKIIRDTKRKTAKSIVNIVASGLDAVAQMYTGISQFGRYKPPDENLQEIYSIVEEMLPDDNPDIPKWLFLAIAIFGAYSPVITKVKQDKNKANLKSEKTNYFDE